MKQNVTRVEVNRNALLHNVEVFRNLCPQSLFLAVVKSNAYGHGLPQVVSQLRGHVDWFGVNSLEEARQVREWDSQTPVLAMGAGNLLQEEELRSLSSLSGITLVLSTVSAIQLLQRVAPGTPFHLKVDTGMSRLGCHNGDLEEILLFLRRNPDLPWRGVMTHFANVEDVTDQDYALEQLKLFQAAREASLEAAEGRPLLFHAAASAAAMILPESRMDMIRVGISLYGLWPSHSTRISLLGLNGSIPTLHPVLRWVTRVVHLNWISTGSCVGYGCTHKVPRETLLAVLPVGYFEGYERALSNRSQVIIRGHRAPLLGRVCMNMIMVDVSHIHPPVQEGEEAVLLGREGEEEVSADELASITSTINYEVVSRIQKDLERVVVDAGNYLTRSNPPSQLDTGRL